MDGYNEALSRRSRGDTVGALQLLDMVHLAAAADDGLRDTHIGQILYARSCGEIATLSGWRLSVWNSEVPAALPQ